MSNSLDCSNSLQPCNCSPSQICIQVGRSGTQCAYNTCIARSASADGSHKSNIGALAGEAVGGVLAALALIIAAYWFWWKRTNARGSTAAHAARKQPTGLREFKIGASAGQNPQAEKDITASPGPGEADAAPVKRQSLRFDPNNNQSTTRRSLSASGKNALLPSPSAAATDNPFGDHHSLHGSAIQSPEPADNAPGPARDSHATISEFSFRTSHSTNIIPIAYIPAHSSSHAIADLTTSRNAYGQRTDLPGARHSIATSAISSNQNRAAAMRSSRLSVPFSLRSSGTGLGDSVSRNTVFAGGNTTFSALFDRRFSTVPQSDNGLEIIATSPTTPSSPPLLTPTVTKAGKPIRPPRAPGLDLKLPTPEPVSPPPTSPSYPWGSVQSGQTSPATTTSPSGRTLLVPPGSGKRHGHSRETLKGKVAGGPRNSAYSTFSQTTGSTASHMSYILDPPQVSL